MSEQKRNECLEAAKKQAENYRRFYGPSNGELLKEIKELKEQVAYLINKVNQILPELS